MVVCLLAGFIVEVHAKEWIVLLWYGVVNDESVGLMSVVIDADTETEKRTIVETLSEGATGKQTEGTLHGGRREAGTSESCMYIPSRNASNKANQAWDARRQSMQVHDSQSSSGD